MFLTGVWSSRRKIKWMGSDFDQMIFGHTDKKSNFIDRRINQAGPQVCGL
jgi:hypothetical protein